MTKTTPTPPEVVALLDLLEQPGSPPLWTSQGLARGDRARKARLLSRLSVEELAELHEGTRAALAKQRTR